MSLLPTQLLAGITVPDTPLITKALLYTRARLNDMGYNHVVRSWLFGFVIAGKDADLRDRDLEIHSISAILHDLGWDITGGLISQDKRFEVDGANAARDFLRREAGAEWDQRRLQLVWDAIALHTTRSIASYKEAEVAATSYGIGADFGGPPGSHGGLLTWEEYNKIVREFPRLGLKEGVREIMCHLCKTKPETTYDNFVGQYGERFVKGFSLVGKLGVDHIENGTLE
ncbi:hypothetical protein MMC24_000714 [Lignoscripta atroalba]|nr:hypothetical protein [Lignoscripta atroalba]